MIIVKKSPAVVIQRRKNTEPSYQPLPVWTRLVMRCTTAVPTWWSDWWALMMRPRSGKRYVEKIQKLLQSSCSAFFLLTQIIQLFRIFQSKLGCCLYQNFEKCVLAATAKRCGTKVRNFLDGYLQVTARETFDLLCASGQDACSDMKPVVPRKDLNLDTDGPQNIFEGVHYILERVQTKNWECDLQNYLLLEPLHFQTTFITKKWASKQTKC